MERVKADLAAGRVYQQENFLTEQQMLVLEGNIHELRDEFVPSGLSNTAQQQQGFGRQDRMVCTVPWWKDSLAETSDKTRPSSIVLNKNDNLASIAAQLQELRHQLATSLQRPTMHQVTTVAHECYYSVSQPGSFLPRHLDERHEELKGTKGWLLPSRRSLSWLVYLSNDDDDWSIDTHGGALRAFCPPTDSLQHQPCVHDGNLQIAWLVANESSARHQAVYLDSWHVPEQSSEPHCILYTVDHNKMKQYITRPWQPPSIGTVAEFLQRQTAESSLLFFTDALTAQRFALLEDRVAWEAGQVPRNSVIQDVNPTRGSLVIFDSVRVPHQVETIIKGQRTALAGWFHEETQAIPTDLF